MNHELRLKLRNRLGNTLGTVGRYVPLSWRKRLARRSSRWAYLLLDEGDFVVSDYLGGLSFTIDVRRSVEREILSGVYEPELLASIAQCVGPDSVCIDVGANSGAVTLALAAKATQGKVFAFEPGPEFFSRLEKNVGLNPDLGSRVSLHNLGVGSAPGTLRWVEDIRSPGNAWCLADRGGTEVPVTTLDRFFQANPVHRVDFIKIDTEGMEWEILQGAKETLRRFHPVVYLETSLVFESIRRVPVRKWCADWLGDLGYRLYDPKTDRPVSYPRLPPNSIALYS